MPTVRLSGDFLEHKAGATVDLTNDEYSEALHACVVAKTYPAPRVAAKKTAKRAAKKATAPKSDRPAADSYQRPSE